MLKILNHQVRNLISLKENDKDWLNSNIKNIDKKDLLKLIESLNESLTCFEEVIDCVDVLDGKQK